MDFTELYHLYFKRLFHLSYSIVRDAHLAEDVVQETFIKAIKHVSSIQDESKVGAWLSAITTRTAIDFVRKEKKNQGVLFDEEILEILGEQVSQNVLEEVEILLLNEEVNRAIKTLTVDYQDVLWLKLEKGLKESEIARILELKPATVKTRIYRARKQLKLLFPEQVSA
ncbi:sigma-70 family RNA polymerase sigma factor [Aquibacillus halophilus]|uniref:RNA polymerase sigma factor n=1 Tax=Aquibacillus halophilus TaxID=930132 RepID=A0A6A8DCT1_9BACI|nr:sigma-70 family RNA polymerase sigma factor [Aquibacillus halophilus]